MLEYLTGLGHRSSELSASSQDIATSCRRTLTFSLLFACYLFHHFYSIINTERLFFIETMLPKGFGFFFNVFARFFHFPFISTLETHLDKIGFVCDFRFF